MTRVFQPKTLHEALAILADREMAATPIAGCTDWMVARHSQARAQEGLVNLLRLDELRGCRREAGTLVIGATTTFSMLRRDEACHGQRAVVAEMAGTIGAWQIQNRATVGGNIANASPAGDSLPLWLALDAEIELGSVGGLRRLPYHSVHTGYRKTALRPGELVVAVRVPPTAEGQRTRFIKVGTRSAQAISKVVLALSAAPDAEGRLGNVRIAAGSVAPVPMRLPNSERLLEGVKPTPELVEAVAREAAKEVAPIDDVRSSAAYRRYVVGRLVRRWLLEEWV